MAELTEVIRCPWCLKDALYKNYHDKEWGRPSHDDGHLFEMLILESFQAGLSWYTILAKRENFRKAFEGFDVHKVAVFKEKKMETLMEDSGIIRNRLKIKAATNNAKLCIEAMKEFGSFSNYLWAFTNHAVIDNAPLSMKDIRATTKLSDTMALDMKKRGFKFMGSTVCYANMQSIGMVNDHLQDCFCRKQDKKS